MIEQKSVLAIIPARGGSKGLPRKNVLELGGVPLIAWSILAAKKSKYIDSLVLSTDCTEIAEVAQCYGCEVPFIRPAMLATDEADTASVVMHVINQLEKKYDIIVLLQPTSPFRNELDIDSALEQFIKNTALTLASVTELNKSPGWLFYVDKEKNTLQRCFDIGAIKLRRQDAQKAYYLNGAIYIVDVNAFIENPCFIDNETCAYMMSSDKSIDIDTIEDFRLAQFKLSKELL